MLDAVIAVSPATRPAVPGRLRAGVRDVLVLLATPIGAVAEAHSLAYSVAFLQTRREAERPAQPGEDGRDPNW